MFRVCLFHQQLLLSYSVTAVLMELCFLSCPLTYAEEPASRLSPGFDGRLIHLQLQASRWPTSNYEYVTFLSAICNSHLTSPVFWRSFTGTVNRNLPQDNIEVRLLERQPTRAQSSIGCKRPSRRWLCEGRCTPLSCDGVRTCEFNLLFSCWHSGLSRNSKQTGIVCTAFIGNSVLRYSLSLLLSWIRNSVGDAHCLVSIVRLPAEGIKHCTQFVLSSLQVNSETHQHPLPLHPVAQAHKKGSTGPPPLYLLFLHWCGNNLVFIVVSLTSTRCLVSTCGNDSNTCFVSISDNIKSLFDRRNIWKHRTADYCVRWKSGRERTVREEERRASGAKNR